MAPSFLTSIEQLHLPMQSWSDLVLVASLVFVVYLFCLGFYRLYLDPLAQFPGPKLAALTTCYQAYYDVYRFGQWFKKIDDLHARYGPIVCINPHELHVSDAEFIDVLFAGNSQKREKYKWIGRSILLPESTVATIPHDLHRRRRAALNPFFSKEKVRRLEPSIQHAVRNLLKRMSQNAANGDVMNLSLVYKATTSDLITGYNFGKSTNYLKREDYNEPFFLAIDENFKIAWLMTYIWWLGPVLASIPPSVMGMIYPGLKSLWDMQVLWTEQIEEIRAAKDLTDNAPTIFHGLLSSSLPDADKRPDRLRQEAQLLVLAGQDTTAHTLTAITYELIACPDELAKLKDELVTAFPDPKDITSAEVEKLPYLTAVIQEGLRLHPGALTRMTRVAPEQTMIYKNNADGKEWKIKPGTPVTMTALPVQMNPVIFPDPRRFKPERWLENPRLDKYLLAFSKGTRNCLGFHLAYAELYLIIASIFRRYDVYDGTGRQKGPTLALYDTIRERDIDAVVDLLVPYPAVGSKGLQVTLRA